jgi:hypothetical protein
MCVMIKQQQDLFGLLYFLNSSINHLTRMIRLCEAGSRTGIFTQLSLWNLNCVRSIGKA